MKTILAVAAAAAIGFGFAASPTNAATALYATEPAAQQACGADEVIWVDLDKGRFYHKGQASYAKSNNGGYACL